MDADGVAYIEAPAEACGTWHYVGKRPLGSGISLFYLPRSPAPGYSLDTMRIDLMQPLPIPLTRWLASDREALSHWAPGHRFELLSDGEHDLVAQATIDHHPVAGPCHLVLRRMRTPSAMARVLLMRKCEALDDGLKSARQRFVESLSVDLSELEWTTPGPWGNAVRAQAHVLQGHVESWAGSLVQVNLAGQIDELLAAASPFAFPEHWALAAHYYAALVDRQMRVDRLAGAARALELTLCRSPDVFDRLVPTQAEYDAMALLGRLRLLGFGAGRADALKRAEVLYCQLAETGRSQGKPEALNHELFSAVALQCLGGPGLAKALDAVDRAHGAAQSALVAATDGLQDCARQMAHVGRRRDPSKLDDACAAVDAVQFILERACIGRGDHEDLYHALAANVQSQVDAQLARHGMYLDEIVETVEFVQRHCCPAPEAGVARSLMFLRPLHSVGRVMMDNAFAWRERLPYESVRAALQRINLEAALNLGLSSAFAISSLGGPLDVFGVPRGSTVGLDQDAWRQTICLELPLVDVVLVLLGETDGLGWELGEIARQSMRDKIVFVVPPESASAVAAPGPGLRKVLREQGYDVGGLPDVPSFAFVASDGTVARCLPFAALWGGSLLTELWSRG